MRVTAILFAFAALPAALSGTQRPAADQIADALLPLPPPARADATVLGWTDDGSRVVTLREGTNGFLCEADRPGNDVFFVHCYPAALRPYLERERELVAAGRGGVALDEVLGPEVRAGTLEIPVGALRSLLSGRINPETGVPDSVRLRYEVLVPFATGPQLGIGGEARRDLPYIMSAGTYESHIMVAGEKRAWAEREGPATTP